MTCPLPTAPYLDQKKTWPKSGKHVMAQAADEYIVVYQAFNDEIGAYAAENKKFKVLLLSLHFRQYLKCFLTGYVCVGCSWMAAKEVRRRVVECVAVTHV